MRKFGMPESNVAHPNVTPLIDVVMCLIVFFMLVAKIGVASGAEEMNLPKAILGSDIKDLGNTITLNVRNVNQPLPMVTTLLPGDASTRELKFEENRGGQVVRPLLEVLKAGRANNPEFKVIIRAEAELPYRLLEPVLFISAEANVKNVNFATESVTATR